MPFVDANNLPGELIRADVAIVGAGAAGIALARELAGDATRVVLLEAGEFRERSVHQAVYRGENTGRINISTAFSRFRVYGGSTTRWGGQCRPLDPIDFEVREGIEHSGWPFTASHLDPYYRRAHEFCRLGRYTYDPADWSDAFGGPLPLESPLLETRVYQFAHPKDLGRVYRETLAHAGNLTVCLNANLVEIQSDAGATQVTGLRVANAHGRMLRVVAGQYVLACGGIENARLLLASRGHRPEGLGNAHDLVGRYFMDHPFVFPGSYEPAHRDFDRNFYVIEGYDQAGSAQGMHAAFSLSEQIIRDEGLNGGSMYLIRRERYKTGAAYWSPGGRAVHHLIEMLQRREHADGRLGRDAVSLVADLPNACRALAARARGLIDREKVLALRVALEATPCRESRVTLGPRTDQFGMRRVQVHWRLNESDKRGYERLLEVLRTELPRLGLGRLQEHGMYEPDGWPSGMIGGKHHMGTTRMHADPREGVVDADCRVHGISNLYVAGSSVFPTGGYANPTLTIVALAMRLADRLKERFRAPAD